MAKKLRYVVCTFCVLLCCVYGGLGSILAAQDASPPLSSDAEPSETAVAPAVSAYSETAASDTEVDRGGEAEMPLPTAAHDAGAGTLPSETASYPTETAALEPAVGADTAALSNSSSKRKVFRTHVFKGGVTAIGTAGADSSFFVAGKDGFVSRYIYPQLQGETYQISDIQVKRIAVHPKKQHIAFYETDEFSVHKISVWDWAAKKQLYAKRFTAAVLSLSWSANGTYLFIGTASAQGITVLDQKGALQSIYKEPPGIVLLAATGPSEKSIVTYGETGRLVYADIKKQKILTQYETEDSLQNPELLKNYTRIAGYKNGNVLVIQATSGEIIESYPAASAIFAGKITDTAPVWIEKGATAHTWHICRGGKKSEAFRLGEKAVITAARNTGTDIIAGTADGHIYRLHQNGDTAVSAAAVAVDTPQEIVDIAVQESQLYILTSDALYTAGQPQLPPLLYADKNPGADKCTPYKNGFLLWSSVRRFPVYYVERGSSPVILYNPSERINSLTVYEENIALVHAFSGFILLQGKTGKKLFEYKAAGLQEAVQLDKNFLLVSKSAADATRCPLFLINVGTGETIPLPLTGQLAFALQSFPQNTCFRLETDPHDKTDLIRMRINTEVPSESTFQTMLSYKDEDLRAFITEVPQGLVTNLGKNSLVYFDVAKKQIKRLPRDYALPFKAVITDTYIISLNYGGSLSWYKKDSAALVYTMHFE
ncbi:MAG: hypothetical protein ACTTH7_00595 [Treponema sp.]